MSNPFEQKNGQAKEGLSGMQFVPFFGAGKEGGGVQKVKSAAPNQAIRTV